MATPTQPSFIPEPWAETSGNFDTIPATQQETGRASWENGFPLENTIPVAEGGTPSHYLDFQGVLNALSSFAWWQQRGGQFAWSADLEYPVGAFVLGSDGNLYKSIQASTPSDPQNPTTATAYWTIADPTAFLPLSGGTMTGTLTFSNGKAIGDYLLLSGGTMTGTIVGSPEAMSRTSDESYLRLAGGSTWQNGASLWLHGKTMTGYLGEWRLQANNGTNTTSLSAKPTGELNWSGTEFKPSTNGQSTLGTASIKWGQIYSTSSTISTSDERLKADIDAIPDEVLDVWGHVNWQEFKFRDSIEKKGENARLHTGLIAQQIKEAFEARGLDASRYGLFCHDEWNAKDAEIDEEGNEIEPAIDAGDVFSLRYEEALAMEAAYQRRRADRLEARLDAIEKRLSMIDGDLR